MSDSYAVGDIIEAKGHGTTMWRGVISGIRPGFWNPESLTSTDGYNIDWTHRNDENRGWFEWKDNSTVIRMTSLGRFPKWR